MICRLEWGIRGARRAAQRGDIVVIVDTLSFSTTVTTAVAAGAHIIPTFDKANSAEYAERMGAEAAVSRKDVPAKGRFSLSPLTMLEATEKQRIVLPSPNGARCSLAGAGSPMVCAGTIVNARAAASLIQEKAIDIGCDVSLIACGEAEDPYNPDAAIRFALEDFLGAGAVAGHLDAEKSPELRAAEAAFGVAVSNILNELLGCESGKEMAGTGFRRDVEFAAHADSIEAVAVFDGEKYSSHQVPKTTE